MFKMAGSLLGIALFAGVVSSARAGEISGVLKYKDGSIAKRVGVSGLASGALGGTIDKVYTDGQGRFVLKWSSKADVAKVYVGGDVVATNIKNGTKDVKLTIK